MLKPLPELPLTVNRGFDSKLQLIAAFHQHSCMIMKILGSWLLYENWWYSQFMKLTVENNLNYVCTVQFYSIISINTWLSLCDCLFMSTYRCIYRDWMQIELRSKATFCWHHKLQVLRSFGGFLERRNVNFAAGTLEQCFCPYPANTVSLSKTLSMFGTWFKPDTNLFWVWFEYV